MNCMNGSVSRHCVRLSWFGGFGGMAVAASMLLILPMVFFLSSSFNSPSNTVVETSYVTQVGEFKTVVLSDLTHVTLNTNSRISVQYNETSKERRVVLHQGEAYFDIAKDAFRPFIVGSGEVEVKALGTAFNVEKGKAKLEVIVTEGIVLISDKTVASSAIDNGDQLQAGQVFVLNKSVKNISELELMSIEQKLAWQTGRVFFEGEKLENVVGEISRYTTQQFVFVDEQVRDIRIGGSFRVGKIEELLDTIEQGFDVGVNIKPDGLIVLSSTSL